MIIQLDASALRHSHCGRRLYLTLKGYRSKFLDASMEYGSALHVFLEAIALGKDPEESKQLALSYYLEKQSDPMFKYKTSKVEYLNILHLRRSLNVLEKEWSLGNILSGNTILKSPKGNPMVESTFSIPFYKSGDVEILLCGTIDLLTATSGANYLCVVSDYKSTASWDKKSYLSKYLWDPQLRMYQLAIKLQAKLQPDSIWREIWEGHRIGGRIVGLFHHPENTIAVQASDIMWLDRDGLNDFEQLLTQQCMNIALDFQGKSENYLPYRQGIFTATCEGKFGGVESSLCPFASACLQDDETAYAIINNGTFKIQQYEPLTFRR